MRLRHAMLSSAVQHNATLLLSLVTGIVIAHLLTPREAGSYAVAMASINALAALKDSAIGTYVVSAPRLDDDLLKTAFGVSLIVALCLTVGFFTLSFPLADFYHDQALGPILRIMALAQLGPALAFPATMILMRTMRFDRLLAIGLIAAICQSLVAIALALLGSGAAALAWGYLASAVVAAAATIWCRLDVARLRPTLKGSRDLLAFGSWTSATLLIGNAATSAPELMIGRALGMANAALFARGQNLVTFVRNGLYIGMTRPLLPRLGEHERRGASLAPLYQRIVETITGLAWPAYAVLAIWGEPLVRTIYGEAWSAAGTMMTPIAIAHALTLTVAPHHDILIVKRRQHLLFAAELAVFLVTVGAFAAGLTLGVNGAVWSLVLSSAFFAVCYFVVIKATIAFPPGALIKAWGRSLTLVLAILPSTLAFRYFAQTSAEIMLGFAASSAIAAVIWVVVTVLIRHELSLHMSGLLDSLPLPPPFRRLSRLLAAAQKQSSGAAAPQSS
jgi:O-antigen/teichoic acid export membrane protein